MQLDDRLLRRRIVAVRALRVAVRHHLHHRPRKLGLARGACGLKHLAANQIDGLAQQLLQQRRRQIFALTHRDGEHAVVGRRAARGSNSRAARMPRSALRATLRTTSRSPRRRITSVTCSEIAARCEIASRCGCPFMRAISISVASSISGETRSSGPDTLIASSCDQFAHDRRRRVDERGETVGKIGADLAVGLRQQAFENSVEQRDMLRIEILRALPQTACRACARRPPAARG